MSQNWRTYGNSDINDADEAYRNRSTAAEEATPEPLTDDIDINVEQPVGTIIEYRGERWLVLSSDYVTAGDAADLEDGWDATVSVGWHTHLRRVKAGDKVLEVVADRFAAGEVQRIGDRGVWFIDEEHAIFWEDLAYDSELGLYQKSKFPQKGGASDQR